jgi:hypothetical protein
VLWLTRGRLGVEPLERRRVIRARRSALNLIHGLDTRNPRGGGRGSRAGRSVPVLLAVVAVLMAACQAPVPGPIPQTWIEVKGLGHVISAAPPGARSGWLLGGGVIGPDGVNQVAIWSAAQPSGPWRRDAMAPVPGRDGPNETIQGFAIPAGSGLLAAVGSRPSPTEGYPRPSTWTASAGPGSPAWREALAARELFGGPNVVAIGGAGAGPHGYFIAGTWIGLDNHVVAAVWRSGAGLRWDRDDTEAAFDAGPASQSYALAVGDGPSGVLLGGTTAQPEPGDPTREIPTLWHSPDGAGWARLPTPPSGGRGVIRAVRALGTGWVAAGQAGSRPEAWTLTSGLHPSARTLPGAAAATVDDLAVTPTSVWAVGLTPAGSVLLWRAAHHGVQVRGWTAVNPPPAGVGWSGASLAAAGGELIVVASNSTRSEVWRAT